MAGKKKNRFSVWSKMDRGEKAEPRYIAGYCNMFNLTREDAEAMLKQERAKPYVVEASIKETPERL